MSASQVVIFCSEQVARNGTLKSRYIRFFKKNEKIAKNTPFIFALLPLSTEKSCDSR
jgi:hypothetical protein